MIVFITRRLMQSILVLLVVSLLVFSGVYAIGNPVDVLISPEATQSERAALIASLGLDQPLWMQYWTFLKNALQGNLGNSFAYSIPAIGLIVERMPATMELAILAILISIVLGIPLGLWAGMRPKSRSGKAIMCSSSDLI